MLLSDMIHAIREQLGKRLTILGHHYQTDDIIRHCDFTGDSLELARRIPGIDSEYIVFCGVSFMGESAALLTREDQQVFLPEPDADCMMALMASACHVQNVLEELKGAGIRAFPLAYVNTSLSLKAVVGRWGGTVCTSANAATVLARALKESDTVLFLPDKNLGRNVGTALGLSGSDMHLLRLSGFGLKDPADPALRRRLLLWPGSCPIHGERTVSEITALKERHPDARILVHPECPPEIVQAADGSGSTSYLIRKAEESARDTPMTPLVIGTESNLVHRLQARHTEARILPLFRGYCPDMNAVTEEKLLALLEKILQSRATPLRVPDQEKEPARHALERMLAVCENATAAQAL